LGSAFTGGFLSKVGFGRSWAEGVRSTGVASPKAGLEASSDVPPRFHDVARAEVGATTSSSGFHSNAPSSFKASASSLGGGGESNTLLNRVLRGFMEEKSDASESRL
jgi:hypothetical protein